MEFLPVYKLQIYVCTRFFVYLCQLLFDIQPQALKGTHIFIIFPKEEISLNQLAETITYIS